MNTRHIGGATGPIKTPMLLTRSLAIHDKTVVVLNKILQEHSKNELFFIFGEQRMTFNTRGSQASGIIRNGDPLSSKYLKYILYDSAKVLGIILYLDYTL